MPRKGKVVLPKSTFEKDAAQKYGYDDYTNRDAKPQHVVKSVEKTKTDTAKLIIDPAALAGQVTITSSDVNKITVVPAVAAGSPQTVTVTGVAKGVAVVQTKVRNQNTAKMTTCCYDKLTKTVAIIVVNEGNDDVQAIPVNQGEANAIAITFGVNGVNNSVAAGDDQLVAGGIDTGANGVCQTTKGGDDVQVIPVGKGKANVVCVTEGANTKLDTNEVADDVVVGEKVNTGPDGICQTTANATNVAGTDNVNVAALTTYLNQTIYNQAVVEWTVTKLAAQTTNYDLNRDDEVDVTTNGCISPEAQEIINGVAGVGAFDKVLFMVDNPDDGSFGCMPFNQKWGFIHPSTHVGAQTLNNTIAHELGHGTGGLVHPDQNGDPDPTNLMHSTNANPEKLRKNQWDLLNP